MGQPGSALVAHARPSARIAGARVCGAIPDIADEPCRPSVSGDKVLSVPASGLLMRRGTPW